MRTALCACLALLLLTTPAFAKEPGDYVDDARDYALAPLHWDRHDWLLAGEAAAATAAAYSVDSSVRNHFASAPNTVRGDPHSLRDSVPMAALVIGTFASGLITDRPELRATARDMTEAVVLASGGAFVLKHVFARTRPDATQDKSSWRSGGDSFPSGHTAAAFAAAQVFVDGRSPDEWGLKLAAYSLGAVTAYARLDGNLHWLSDTVAGAAVGMATGRFLSNRSRDDGALGLAQLDLQPTKGGAILSLSVDPYALLER